MESAETDEKNLVWKQNEKQPVSYCSTCYLLYDVNSYVDKTKIRCYCMYSTCTKWNSVRSIMYLDMIL